MPSSPSWKCDVRATCIHTYIHTHFYSTVVIASVYAVQLRMSAWFAEREATWYIEKFT